VNASGWLDLTALMITAAANRPSEFIQVLIAAGADVNAATDIGFTALVEAARNTEYPQVIEMLVAAGAVVDAKDILGRTALMHAAWLNPKSGDSRSAARSWSRPETEIV